MLYTIITKDKEGALQTRLDNREAHLAYIADTGVVQMAGPFINADGEMHGSMIILDVEDRAAAEAWAESDPYAKAGLFERVRIEQWKKVIG
ncbi:YciI family protein [Marivivens donghaensis]|uniref:YciI family protein n=1 Tax=Marivivens donghaensis TaxID=1699413 RepID=A0ABX0VXM8_9RHOB|nr:YciI family protein [Marivivens donghaensis]NIY71412.1 YciI family protein [Marivivens donghaensis]